MRFKCHTCHSILNIPKGEKCACGETHLQEMCELDHLCTCPLEISSGLIYCKECGQPTCPCGSHDVITISRVTGYLASVEGFNAAKKAELRDRKRYDI